MPRTNRTWLPKYSDPEAYLPKIQESRSLFAEPPYLFRDFVGLAHSFLKSDQAKKMGFEYDPKNILPCKWKCADEALFAVDLAMYASTGRYPFDKGMIGGRFNDASVRAAVHHGSINVDFGGSHLGYIPGEHGGKFGNIYRPLTREPSTDCGALMGMIEPFKRIYDDACENILLFNPDGNKPLLSIPNEFLQPSWSIHPIKLLIDTEILTAGSVPYTIELPHTHTPIGRTLFYLKPALLEELSEEEVKKFNTPKPVPVGPHLTHHFFNIFDTSCAIDDHGLPQKKLHLYMKFLLTARNSPFPLKAAIINTNLEYNRLTDTVRSAEYKPYSFASFTGVFIDIFHEEINNYFNLFQPLGLSIKPANSTHLHELMPDEIHHIFDKLTPTEPVLPFKNVMGIDLPKNVVELFTFKPGYFQKDYNPWAAS